MDSIHALTSDEASVNATSTMPSDAAATETEASSTESTSLKSLKDFVDDLNVATDVILHSARRRYSQVTALVACWPDEISDRKHMRQSAKQLCRVLGEKYKFDVDKKPYVINKAGPQIDFTMKLLTTLTKTTTSFKPPEKPEDPTKLFILYYGGHAVRKNGNMVWRPRENAEKQTEVVWTDLVGLFKDFDGDLLFLFDCCYAGDMIGREREFKRRCEVFCASLGSKKASGEEAHSFTRALVGELDTEAKTRRVCEIKQLRSRLNLQEKKETYKLKVDPYWDRLTRSGTKSICLAPLEDDCEDLPPKSLAETAREMEGLAGARVVFKATFEDPEDRPVIEEWKEFVHWRPGGLNDLQWYAMRETQFQSLFKSNSSSAIISIPMILWDSMPKRAAYEFISVGRSTDMLVDLPRRNQAACQVDQQPTTSSRMTTHSPTALVDERPGTGSVPRLYEAPVPKGGDEVSSAQLSWLISTRTRPSQPQVLMAQEIQSMGRPDTYNASYLVVSPGVESERDRKLLQRISKHGPTMEQMQNKVSKLDRKTSKIMRFWGHSPTVR
ncbi:NACHT and TPR domain-containing [Fusarium albosuccineum]|uniref:NACHT and TPR domain-containing n=1 Tax=Fusarium albosuccineum TaxID=1237068 RepID=A0A8H4KSJ2_9HYPO|nr:NACHT and TPR domain-containing [Fusarium albosuccineum]